MKGDDREPLVSTPNPSGWGSINAVVNAPLIDVPPDASWLSVILMWLTLPINLVQGAVAGLVGWAFVGISIGYCNCCGCWKLVSAAGSVLLGRPFLMAWTWWRYVFAGLIGLVANGSSRLALFIWEWNAFGAAEYWWHGEGLWCWSYKDVDGILRSQQERYPAFGCVRACIPDLFATNILIFLSNSPDPHSQWRTIRTALHDLFLDRGAKAYQERVAALSDNLAADWPSPGVEALNDTTRLQKSVCKCVFWVMFGVWITDEDAAVLTGWRTNATFFVLPRLVQRFLFNYGINKVKTLREDTVAIVEKYGQQGVFVDMNNRLGDWKRAPIVKLCDEIMYVIGFAGMGGTSAAVESTASFLQAKVPAESAAEHINFGQYDTQKKMIQKYLASPEQYIKETCRLDPPVTSATASLKEPVRVTLAGRQFDLPANLLNQYVMSMANRDVTKFSKPEEFMPDRPNLSEALTWNGAFGAQDELDYPRICPGRYLSMDVTMAVIGHVLGAPEDKRGLSVGAVAEPKCC